MEEESDDIADDETDFSTGAENGAARNLVVAAVVTLDYRALGEDEVEGECGQGERGEEADPNENRVGFDHATVSDHRPNEPAREIPSSIKYGGDRKEITGASGAHPKRDMRAMTARTTPAIMRPILAPDEILTWLSFKRSGRESTASGRDEDEHGKRVRRILKRRVAYCGRARKMHQHRDHHR